MVPQEMLRVADPKRGGRLYMSNMRRAVDGRAKRTTTPRSAEQ